MAKSTINRQQLFLEFVFIVFAVLLALLLNSWRESILTSRAVDKVKQTIHTEMNSNSEVVTEALAYRRALIQELRQGRHLVFAFPVSDFPIDVYNDKAFESYFRKILPFSSSSALERLEVLRNDGDERVMVLDDLNMQLVVENDTVKLFGATNIRLHTADISNRSWEIAQATGTLVEMDLALVDALNKCYNLNNLYMRTSDKAIDMIYKGEPGVTSVMEDMAYFEQQILKADSVVLTLLD